MRKVTRAIVATAGLMVAAACGGGRSSSNGIPGGPVTAPTPPSAPIPPTVNVTGGGSAQLVWAGDVSFDQPTEPYTMHLQLTQTGSQVSGQVNLFGSEGGAGPFAGTVSGNTLAFNFSIGNMSLGCGNTISGTASVATSTMIGTFNGKRCDTTPYTNARFTLSLPSPFRTSPFPVAGTWTANIPAALGGGRWAFTIAETISDVNASNVSGSVAVTGSTLALGTGSLSGPVTDTFPGPNTIARMSVTFAGACASNLTANVGFPGGDPDFDGNRMTGGITGTTCSGPLAQSLGINLFRQ